MPVALDKGSGSSDGRSAKSMPARVKDKSAQRVIQKLKEMVEANAQVITPTLIAVICSRLGNDDRDTHDGIEKVKGRNGPDPETLRRFDKCLQLNPRFRAAPDMTQIRKRLPLFLNS